jgi:hypothetical protein
VDTAGDNELKMEVLEAAMQQLTRPGVYGTTEARGAGVLGGGRPVVFVGRGDAVRISPDTNNTKGTAKLKQERLTAVVVLPERYSKAWWNMAAPNITKSVVLGLATDVLKAGPAMPQDSELPPGKLIMAVVTYS